jgi:hypothetical protein
MKKSIQLFALLLISSVVLFSCSNSQKPEDVATQFTKAMKEQKWEEAKKLSDEETKGLIELMASFSKMGDSASKSNDVKKASAEELIFVKSEVKDSTAIVYFKDKATSKEEKIPMRKVNGKWLVAIKKEGLNKEGMGGDNSASGSMDTTGMQNTADTSLLQTADTSVKAH